MGALEGEVLLQFLIEAVVLCALGGVIGVLIATAASYGLSRLMAVPYEFDAAIDLLALLFSAFNGVLFGDGIDPPQLHAGSARTRSWRPHTR